MANWVSTIATQINSRLQEWQLKRFFAVVLVGFLVLTTNINSGRNSEAVTRRLDQVVHQDDAQRPKTTGEWNQEARETEEVPGERAKRIAKESGEAIKQWGSLYPNTAQRSANELQENQR
ncbi:hypothetical protein [Nostoc sp. TCL26-01]|uniref:hypothetical protein n=1 Tax=Nostoc sp. TCL26-01 TaxID=2576904 RepID=UPI0015C04195|nr:hypothetical protein [Nostoc sp. TCL26-01]QLE56787.1 hypothetical protein FD725_15490 [Nostoc sp. TCL26-01]